jgi:hypothetical protein
MQEMHWPKVVEKKEGQALTRAKKQAYGAWLGSAERSLALFRSFHRLVMGDHNVFLFEKGSNCY